MNEWILLVAVMVMHGSDGGTAVSTERFGPYPTEQQCRTAMKQPQPDKTHRVEQGRVYWLGSAYACIPQPKESR